MPKSTVGDPPDTVESKKQAIQHVVMEGPVRTPGNDASSEQIVSAEDERKAVPPATEPASVGRWKALVSGISRIANQKIDITIGRLTFIVSIVALVVALLSYGYGAASYRVAKNAYQLQQLEFCKDHSEDPVGCSTSRYFCILLLNLVE